jgi:hypothetical protein
MNKLRSVTGTVVELQCSLCGKRFPHFIFSGDTDMVTSGLASVTSCELNEVVLAELNADQGGEGGAAFERRLSKQLNRNDMRVVHLLAVERTSPAYRGESFQEYRKRYTRPSLVYSCAYCAGGQSRSLGEATVEEFERSGGKISVVDDLGLDDESYQGAADQP